MMIESTYHLKWISWNSGMIPIVMQSANGPCPLIATMNVLLLKEKIKLPEMLEQITEAQLLAYIGESIMDSVPPPDMQNDENFLLNLEQNIHDAIEILPKLKSGLDVNIRFTGITDFEYTPECIIFDLLRIHLYHGWLIDPESSVLEEAIGTQSYNQLVDSIITNKASSDSMIATRVLVAEDFLERTASQLTVHGLKELKSKILDNEIGILFRNNHFLTLFKRDGEIYTLVTDHGYLTESNIVWETLDSIEGAGIFFDANFQPSEFADRQVQTYKDEQQKKQLMNDLLVALSLKEEETLEATERKRQLELRDLEMAKRLQEEEDGLVNPERRMVPYSSETHRDQNLGLVPSTSNANPSAPTNSPISKDTQTSQRTEPSTESTHPVGTGSQAPPSSDLRTFPKLVKSPLTELNRDDREGGFSLQKRDFSISSSPSSNCVEVFSQDTINSATQEVNLSDQIQYQRREKRSSVDQSASTYAAVADPKRGANQNDPQYETNPTVPTPPVIQPQSRPSSGRNGSRSRAEKSRESSCRVH